MFKALIRKKLQEFKANHITSVFPFLFAVSLLSLLRVWFDEALVIVVSLLPLLAFGWLMGVTCALTAFAGDSTNQVNRFLEYLPLQKSAIWLSNYVCGLGLLILAAVSLFLIDVVLFPLGGGENSIWHETRPYMQFLYFVPSGIAAVVSGSCFLFWMYSIATFPAAFLVGTDTQGSNAQGTNGLGVLFAIGSVLSPIATTAFLGQLSIAPTGLTLSSVLLTSAVLFSAGSYALFALVPRHINPIKHAMLGVGLFALISATFFGQLYIKFLSWQVLDSTQVEQVHAVYSPHLEGETNLLLANVMSYRSGLHCVAIDVEQAGHSDLGRGLTYIDVPKNDSGRLHFSYDPEAVFPSYHSDRGYFLSMLPSAAKKHSVRVADARRGSPKNAQWLLEKGLVVYTAHTKGNSHSDLCVADASSNVLRRFAVRDSQSFLVDPSGRALAIAPTKTTSEASSDTTSSKPDQPYMSINLDTGSVERFSLPGDVVFFAKDLKRVICLRKRIENGQQYQSYVLVELPTLEERTLISEDDFQPEQITAQLDTTVRPMILIDNGVLTTTLRVNDAFDSVLWRKQRTEGDYFRYSIVLIDLDTGQQQVVVPESATPKMPVVIAKGAQQETVIIHRFTDDDTAFSYSIGSRTYLYDLDERQSTLLADTNTSSDEDHQERQPAASTYSPSGRHVLHFDNVWHTTSELQRRPRFNFSAIEIFKNGKPVRLYTGKQPIGGALWLDNDRIVFFEKASIYLLKSSGGAPVKVFPVIGKR